MMKRRLRSKYWWPKLDEDVKTCKSCALVSNPSRPEPMIRRELPAAPWVDVAIGFPLPTKEYVLVAIMRSITATFFDFENENSHFPHCVAVKTSPITGALQ